MKGNTPVKHIKTGLRVTIEFLLFLAILLGAAIAPGLLSGRNSTIVLPQHSYQEASR
jgi:hypothetical protein